MKLKLTDLRVESFLTDEAEADTRGTVEAYESVTWRFSCPPVYTCPECRDP
ncbi:MAG TPA: pinensin family lanthipeptide [Longimicrobium sp.]|nr:pinensin family lanthipeptide [Longimicrobium sp.]